MKVAITTKKELHKPHLELDINLETGTMTATLKYTCAKCAGYGCHFSGGCDDHTNLEPENIIETLGEDCRPVLKQLFKQIFGNDEPSIRSYP